jgi:hypothetical protein
MIWTLRRLSQRILQTPLIHFRFLLIGAGVCFLSHCGDAVVPLGGIVGNGQKPEKPQKAPSDASDPTDPSPAFEQALTILDGKYAVQVPAGYKRIIDSVDQFESYEGLKLTIAWAEPTTSCDQISRFQTVAGLNVTICSDTRAIVETIQSIPEDASKAQIEVNHALNEQTLKAMLNTLRAFR